MILSKISFLVGLVGICFFGLSFLYLFYRTFFPKPSVIINENGIFDNGSYCGVGWIKWEEIDKIIFYNFSAFGRSKNKFINWFLPPPQRFIGILTKNLENILLRVNNNLKKKTILANRRFSSTPINIPDIALSVSIDELIPYIKKYFNNIEVKS